MRSFAQAAIIFALIPFITGAPAEAIEARTNTLLCTDNPLGLSDYAYTITCKTVAFAVCQNGSPTVLIQGIDYFDCLNGCYCV